MRNTLALAATLFLAPVTASAMSDMDALYLCQQAMKSASIDPDKAKVPYVKVTSSVDEYNMSWGRSTKHMRMRNGMGNEVPVSGSCAVSKSARKIVYMTIDGKTVID